MDLSFDIIVVGGGVIGLSAAIAMRQKGFSVAIVDAGAMSVDVSTPDLRVYALNQASQSLLQTLSIWPYVDKTRVSPYSHMHVEDAANGAHIDFDARMIGKHQLGVIIEESILKQAALQQLNESDIVCFPNCRIDSVQSAEQGVTLKSGTQTWQAKWLIVADGPTSTVRGLLNVPLTSWPYHQSALVTRVKTQKLHQNTAWQIFTENGPLAFLPLNDPHECSIVWSTSPAHVDYLMKQSNEVFAEQLAHAFKDTLGACDVMGTRHQFPLIMRHAKQYCGPNWLLMGDAAHTIHPLAGLGLNVGLEDLACWIHHLAKNKVISKKILGAYQRERKARVWQTIALMGCLKTMFANPIPSVTALRGLGITACNHLSPLKRLFIEYAGNT